MAEIQNLEEKVNTAQFYNDAIGFACFYELCYGRDLPKHVFEWVQQIYKSKDEGRGTVIEAFRGSTKTTSITVAFTAFQIGHHPEDSFMFIQASDVSAAMNAQTVADLITLNPAWKIVFPHVTKDDDMPWGEKKGYTVKSSMIKRPADNEVGFTYEAIDYSSWHRHRSAITPNPTLLGLGYNSKTIIGKHPTGMLLIDDIHDEDNSGSDRRLQDVRTKVNGTIIPITTTPDSATRFRIVIGTPWRTNDVLADFKTRERYDNVFTPIMFGDRSTWPEMFPIERIEEEIRPDTNSEIEFARMYLLDLTAAEGVHLKAHWLREYELEEHSDWRSWDVVMGIDYASTADEWETKGKERDYFALAVGRVIPGIGGGIVLETGLRQRLSQGEAFAKVRSMAAMYPTLRGIGVEAVGKGEEFFHLLHRTSELTVEPLFTKGKSKGWRFETQMAPMFQARRAYIASHSDEFIEHLKKEWLQFPYGSHDDTLDAVYWMLYYGRYHLQGIPMSQEQGVLNPMFPRTKKRRNPALDFGRK